MGQPIEDDAGPLVDSEGRLYEQDGYDPCYKIDVVMVYSIITVGIMTGYYSQLVRRRYGPICDETAWTQDFSSMESGVYGVQTCCYAPNVTGGCVAAVINSTFNRTRFYSVDITDGSITGTLKEFPGSTSGGLSQEVNRYIVYSGDLHHNHPSSSGSTAINIEGGVVLGYCGGIANLGAAAFEEAGRLYFLRSGGAAISRVRDTSACVSGGTIQHCALGDDTWMIYDENTRAFWVIGPELVGFDTVVAVRQVDLDTAETINLTFATEQLSYVSLLADPQAFTLHTTGLWWIQSRRYLLHYDIADGTLELVFARCDGSEMDVPYFFGQSFIAGPASSCNHNCACNPEIVLTRNFDTRPSETICEQIDPLEPDCCGPDDQDFISCMVYYDYEITLCPGTTLETLYFAGTRGRVYIDGVPLDNYTPQSTIPLTGVISFDYSDVCGVHEGTWSVTVIDDQGCCATATEDVSCCVCCPAGGSANLEFDVSIDGIDGSNCDQPTDIQPCPECNWGHRYCYYKVIFGPGIPSDCSPIGNAINDIRVCYLVDWRCITLRTGGAPPGICHPGDEVRIRFDDGCDGDCCCVAITPFDALGGDECMGETFYLPHFTTGWCYNTGTDYSALTGCALTYALAHEFDDCEA